MEIVKKIEEAKFITHSGTMHADEVFATAFFDLLYGNVKVFRTINIPSNLEDDVMIYDIGRGKYDHHQEDAKKRENGITYCAFGLIWQEFGKEFLKQQKIENIDEVFTGIDKDLVEGIDADDNGVFPKTEAIYKVKYLSDVIKLFNPSYGSNQDETTQFKKAVEVAKTILLEEVASINGKVIAKEKVLKLLENKENHTLLLNEYMPYEQVLLSEESANDIYFVIFPSNRGGYSIKTVPISSENHNKRMDFPLEWAGLVNEELENVSGIKGITFCHLTRFLVSCDTLVTAKEIINKTLELSQLNEDQIMLDKSE